MNVTAKLSLALLVGSITFAVIGCGGSDDKRPDVGLVTGKVTLNGEALEGATVTFSPVKDSKNPKGGRASFGKTDAEGKYELTYIGEDKGAVIGNHQVRISTAVEAEESTEGDGEPVKASPETVPAIYNKNSKENSDMVKEVKKGEQEINFDLKK